jgi:hypothetical protein
MGYRLMRMEAFFHESEFSFHHGYKRGERISEERKEQAAAYELSISIGVSKPFDPKATDQPSGGIRRCDDLNAIPFLHHTPANHPGKNAFTGHDAFSHLLENSASGVTFLADLGDFQYNLAADRESGAQGQAYQIHAFGGNIFRKITRLERKPHGLHLLYAFHRQQAHLPVPGSITVGVFKQSIIFFEKSSVNIFLAGTLGCTSAHGNDCCHHSFLLTGC